MAIDCARRKNDRQGYKGQRQKGASAKQVRAGEWIAAGAEGAGVRGGSAAGVRARDRNETRK